MLFCDITLYMNCRYLGIRSGIQHQLVLKARLIEKLVREAAPTTSVWLMNTCQNVACSAGARRLVLGMHAGDA